MFYVVALLSYTRENICFILLGNLKKFELRALAGYTVMNKIVIDGNELEDFIRR